MKDTNNLLTYNQWSAGDYEQSTNGLINASGYQVQLSNQWSHIGENSFKITRIGDSGTWAECDTDTNKKELTASCSILAGNGCGLRVILYYTDDTTIFESVTIPASNNIQTPSVNIVADSTKTVSKVALRINNISSNSFVYVDNIKIF